MKEFDEKCNFLFEQLGKGKKMVLSTSSDDRVTSRMMRIGIIDNQFYFQTDRNFRKYEQLKVNPNVALCFENIQIEGICKETGKPLENEKFCNLYKEVFRNSYENYSSLENERLFIINPVYIQKWIYENGEPYLEKFDFVKNTYKKEKYIQK